MRIQGFRSPGAGLRLHLNENMQGCSPAVIETIRALTPQQLAEYADYEPAVLACAAHFGVDPEWVFLTNGLDEGILMTALAFLGRDKSVGAEAIVPLPAFEPYFAAVDAVGATAVPVLPGTGFSFPTDALLAAVSSRTRLVFLNTPNNPTGRLIPRDAIRRVVVSAPEAPVLVDEAYIEFTGESFLDELSSHRNVIIGRTFSKAYGLAGIRIGCLIAHPDLLEPIRAVTPVLNLNVVAVTAVQAALRDREYMARYAAQVAESKRRVYSACRRLGFECWESAANFVLVRVGDQASFIVAALSARGVHVRDRSMDPQTPGCIRLTAGLVAHTDAAIDALAVVASARAETAGQ
jgi:histidinol-phosphate aminotransferase